MEPTEKHTFFQKLPFLVAIGRGITAVLLGVVLLINPNKSQGLLFNFMGGFWLSSGFLLLHKDADKAFQTLGKRTSLILGFMAIVTGLLVMTRHLTERWVDKALLLQLLGLVILLTGILHVYGEVRIGLRQREGLTFAHFVLGIFEIVLGVMLLVSPLSHGPITYLVATIWALVGGVTIVGTAVYDRYRSHNLEQEFN